MTIDATKLLQRLEPAVRPANTPAPSSNPLAPFEAQGFDELLALVSTGSLSSGRMVELSFTPSEELNTDQMARLTAAADRAEAAGARKALLLIDGRGLVLDVEPRLLTTELTGENNSSLTQLDAAVYVAGDDEPIETGRVPWPGNNILPPAIARQIEAAAQPHESSNTNTH